VGAALMRALERTARERGFREVLLGAQLTAIAFYERLGYVVEGEEFLDARIRHRWMRKVIDRS
jgi:predicted GNAT family N-acyltransferase